MEYSTSFILCFALLFLFDEGEALKCRSSNQQVDAQFAKVLKTCRKRYAGLDTDNDDSGSTDSNSSDNSSSNSEDEDYDRHFFYKKNDQAYNQSMINQKYRNSDRNTDYSSNRANNNGSLRDSQNIKAGRRTNDRESWNSKDSRPMKDDYNNDGTNKGDMNYNNNSTREQTCIVQCFFNELNAVDQKGFPEKDLVISIMSRNIQDDELKDFVEKSITECFRRLEPKKREKCEFSQDLLICLAEKGRQNCEDWS